MTDLDKLIDAVERGCPRYDAGFLGVDLNVCVNGAFTGSLDAAEALHDALLPGWVARPQIGGVGAGVKVWHCTVEEWNSGEEVEANNMPCPARAWMLAILKAYRAQQVTE